MEPQLDRLARIAYEAHNAARKHVNLEGKALWRWEELPEDLRDAWRASVVASFEAYGIQLRL